MPPKVFLQREHPATVWLFALLGFGVCFFMLAALVRLEEVFVAVRTWIAFVFSRTRRV